MLKIENWFPVNRGYVYNSNHNNIEQKLTDYCLKLKNKTKSGGETWLSKTVYNTSGTLNLIEDQNFKDLNNWVKKMILEYIEKLKMSYKSYNEFEGWFNVYKKGDYQEWHDHTGSVISCIYFLKSNKDDCRVFFKPRFYDTHNVTYNIDFKPSGFVSYESEPGKLLIFRSYLQHYVEQKKNNEDRITLAYNFN